MKKLTITMIAAAISLTFSAAVLANMSKVEFRAAKKNVEAEYKLAKTGCEPLRANEKDICMAEAKGKENLALAEIGSSYQPSQKARYDVRIAKAQANYSVAKEKCDDYSGNAKNVCMKEAKAAQTAAKADAKVYMKTAEATDTANEKSAKAQGEANQQIAGARKDAAIDKRDAQYDLAKEKCDALAGNAKDHCVNDAKSRYGKL